MSIITNDDSWAIGWNDATIQSISRISKKTDQSFILREARLLTQQELRRLTEELHERAHSTGYVRSEILPKISGLLRALQYIDQRINHHEGF